jgi:hypothetical protein
VPPRTSPTNLQELVHNADFLVRHFQRCNDERFEQSQARANEVAKEKKVILDILKKEPVSNLEKHTLEVARLLRVVASSEFGLAILAGQNVPFWHSVWDLAFPEVWTASQVEQETVVGDVSSQVEQEAALRDVSSQVEQETVVGDVSSHDHRSRTHTHTHASVPHNHMLRAICARPECQATPTHNIHDAPTE